MTAGYFRRPGKPILGLNPTDTAETQYCLEEWSAVLHSVYVSVGSLWLNAPADIARAEDKALQLALADHIGLNIPRTLITNDLDAAAVLSEGAIVAKTFHNGYLEEGNGEPGRIMFTTRLDGFPWTARDQLSLAPITFQREILKECDIRATVVGSRVFAARIESQGRRETEVDWRRGSHPDIPHSRHQLPREVNAK